MLLLTNKTHYLVGNILKSMFLLQVYLACCSAVRSQVQHLGELDVSVHLADAVAHLHTPLDGILFTFIASLKEVLQCLVLKKEVL